MALLLLALLTAAPAAQAPAAAPPACRYEAAARAPRLAGASFDQVATAAAAAWDGERLEEAVRLYRAGVELNPLWNDGRWRLSLLYSEAGCHAEARDALRTVVEIEPDASQGWALLGVSEFRLGELDAALEHLSRATAIGLTAGDVGQQALQAHTLLLVRNGDYATASRQLAALVRLRPDDPEILAACGLMALRMRRLPSEVPDAERELVTSAGRAARLAFLGRMADARREFEALVASHPRTRNVRLAYGLVLARESSSEEALAQLRREVELFPDNAEAHLEIAFEALDRGDPREALAPAREALRLDPESFWSHLAVGRALLATAGSVDEALARLEDAARRAPEVRDVYVALAQAYARAGRKDDVDRVRRKLTEVDARRGAGREP